MEEIAVTWTEWLVNNILFWEEDPKKKGKLLRFVHHSFMHCLFVMILVSHTLYPAFWLQSIILFIWIVIWIHHVLTNGCVVSKVEQKLLEDNESFVDPVMEMFHVKPTREISIAVVVLGSSLVTLLLSLEWIARVSHKIKHIVSKLPFINYYFQLTKEIAE